MRTKLKTAAGLAALALAVASAGLAVARDANPQSTPEEQATLVAGNNAFALDMYQRLRAQADGNFFFSPYSISQALAMTYAGARNETASQMATAMHFGLAPERLHPAFNSLDLALASRSQGAPTGEAGDRFRLNVANAIWPQRDFALLPPFVTTLNDHYGVEVTPLDYINDAEAARLTINGWVEERTENRIQDLIGPGMLDGATRLVLTNAIYFNASWLNAFEPSATQDDTFTRVDESEVTVPMMRQVSNLRYVEEGDYEAVVIPYVGNQLSMGILLPEGGEFADVEAELSSEDIDAVFAESEWTEVDLSLPRFRMESEFSLKDVLSAAGMPMAFDETGADFRNMAEISPEENLYISAVVHKAFVAVDETGTEAAAATAVIVSITSSAAPEPEPPVPFKADRPFIVIIRDEPTGTILFLGRVMNPAG